MNISIFGLGYVGCVSVGCLSSFGHKIYAVDINDFKIKAINSGKATIIEKDISQIIKKNHSLGLIKATSDFVYAVENSSVSFICVGTPGDENGHLNLSSIYNCVEKIAKALKEKKGFHTIVIRSTVIPGTNEKVAKLIEKISNKRNEVDFSVVSNPEFLREGTAVSDFFSPELTVIGSQNEKAIKIIKKIYSDLKSKNIIVDAKVAEIIKYVNNTFHALKVGFANEIGQICKSIGIDSHKVMDLVCEDKKLNISPYYLKPGYAYGGSCLPKDLKGLNSLAHDYEIKTPIINSIESSNQNIKDITLNLILEKKINNVGILGLSFKPGTDDLRNSPSVELCENLINRGINVRIYDKNVVISSLLGANKDYIEKHIPHLSNLITDDLENVVELSELVVITQNSIDYKNLNVKYDDKTFIDLVRIETTNSNNYHGLSW